MDAQLLFDKKGERDMDAQLLFDRLLRAESEPKVDTILNAAGYSLDNEEVWQPLGGMENNFSTVGNQQTEATAAS